MSAALQQVRRWLSRRRELPAENPAAGLAAGPPLSAGSDLEIAPNDPLIPFFQSAPGAVEIDRLDLDSPGLRSLKAAGIKLSIPLVSQGELIGLLNLGPRLSEQEYSADDRALLNNLATQAAPALRVAQLVMQQQAEARQRERLDHELQVARLIQQTLLPKRLPEIPGWQLAAFYRPAREVGGDFYDFVPFPDGKLGLIVGDVTDKGVPAALVMATTRSTFRAVAERLVSPGLVLERVNDLLDPDIPERMFVTCLYALLDPHTGRLRFANAGHNPPYRRAHDRVEELRATGMPLGLMPGIRYEEYEAELSPGECLLFFSDGLTEAHSPRREMFGFPRLVSLLAKGPPTSALIEFLLQELTAFTGPGWDQEDDVTLVTLTRAGDGDPPSGENPGRAAVEPGDAGWRTLLEFQVASQPGNERLALQRVAEVAQELPISPARLEKLKTAVAEATMNAMEHGNRYRPDLPVHLRVLASSSALKVRIVDQGGGAPIPEAQTPDLEAKLAGEQTPRGWGLFLIRSMVDELNVSTDAAHHTIELVMRLEGERDVHTTG